MRLKQGWNFHAGWGGLKTPSEEMNCQMDSLAVSMAILYEAFFDDLF